jgi:hypothetical protein
MRHTIPDGQQDITLNFKELISWWKDRNTQTILYLWESGRWDDGWPPKIDSFF